MTLCIRTLGITPLSIKVHIMPTLSIMTLGIKMLSLMTLGIKTLSLMTLGTMTVIIMTHLIITYKNNDNQQKRHLV